MRRYGLRDDQWDRIKALLPGQPGWVGVTATDIAPVSRGVTCRSASVTGKTFIGATAVGPSPLSGNGSFCISRLMPTTNTR
jgi:hypothetical protein